MSYQKVIPVGSIGSMSITEQGGVATLAISLADSAGGGNVAGFLKAKATVEADVSALMLMDAALDLLAAKFPAGASAIQMLKALVDSEASKL